MSQLLIGGAWVYISGSVLFSMSKCRIMILRLRRSANKMPSAVKAALRDVLQSAAEMSKGEAEAYVAVMEREGRLTEECWS